jgi:hypothetical protein
MKIIRKLCVSRTLSKSETKKKHKNIAEKKAEKFIIEMENKNEK